MLKTLIRVMLKLATGSLEKGCSVMTSQCLIGCCKTFLKMTALCLVHFKKVRSNPAEFLKTQFKSLDCSIMELADDIAYGVHDLEDAIVTGVVNQHQWQEALAELKMIPSDWLAKNIEQVSQRLFSNHHSSVKCHWCISEFLYYPCALESHRQF